MKDWVKCTNCGSEYFIPQAYPVSPEQPIGEERCLYCGEIGTLQWVDEECQEVE